MTAAALLLAALLLAALLLMALLLVALCLGSAAPARAETSTGESVFGVNPGLSEEVLRAILCLGYSVGGSEDIVGKSVWAGALVGFAGGSATASALAAGTAAAVFARAREQLSQENFAVALDDERASLGSRRRRGTALGPSREDP